MAAQPRPAVNQATSNARNSGAFVANGAAVIRGTGAAAASHNEERKAVAAAPTKPKPKAKEESKKV